MKKLLSILTILIILSLVGCTKSTANKNDISPNETSILYSNAEKNSNNEIHADLENYSTADMSVAYDNVKNMKKDSNYILLGKVTQIEYIIVDSEVYTKATLEVEKSLKGNYKKGDQVIYSKYGGITTLDTYWDEVKEHLPHDGSITQDNAKEKTVISYLASKDTLLEVNDLLYIFGDTYKEDRHKKIPKGSLYTIGAYQTEFHVFQDGTIQRYACEDTKNNDMKQNFAEFEAQLQ